MRSYFYRLLPALLATFAVTFMMVFNTAQAAWPDKPVRLIVPLAPGGSVDTVARLVAAQLSEKFGQQFVVDNRSGAGATVGIAIVARANPDG